MPAQASRRVTSCAPSVQPPALPPRNVAAPEANASASVNEANASTSVNEDASSEVRVCRRASCRNSVADCCRTGFCSRHCSSQRCPCFVSLVELHAKPSVCRRRDCATEVAANCSTGYRPTHCRSRRCTCRGVTPDPPAQATCPPARFCPHPDCGNEVAACNSGFCLSHCRCHACSRVRVPTPPPAPHRNAACRRVCRRPDCWVPVAPECRTGFCRQHCTNTNRLWMPDGSEHDAFHGLVDFLRSWGVDMLCVQESRAPDGACLPTGQLYSYDGPTGIGGCEAGFLVHDCSSSWALSSAAPHSRFRWRYAAACETRSNPVLICSFCAPHVGMALELRVSF